MLPGLSQLLWCRVQTHSFEQPWIAFGHLAIPTTCGHRQRLVQCAERGNDEQAEEVGTNTIVYVH